MPDNLELAADGLADARAKLEAVREALQPLLNDREGAHGDLAALVDRLDRMAAEVARIEGVVAGQAVGVAERA